LTGLGIRLWLNDYLIAWWAPTTSTNRPTDQLK